MASLGLDWQLTLLPNGLRLITVVRPWTPVVAVRAYARAGSRYDVEHVPAGSARSNGAPLGLAHLVEHLLFKGTRRHSQCELLAAVERLGGALDAGTSREYMSLSAVVPTRGLASAVEVLAEVLVEPALREDDFWNEKLIVLQEIHQAQARESVIMDLFAQTVWRAHPLRSSVRGTLEGLRDVDYQSSLAFYRRRFVSGNMLLSVCGDVEHRRVIQLVAERFQALPAGEQQPPVAVDEPPMNGPRTGHLHKDLPQLHLLVGVPTVDMKHKDRSTLKVIERVLGMGGSARLYQCLREKGGLVYSIEVASAHYEDAGFFAVHTACAPQNAAQVRAAILAEWDKLRKRGVSEDELHMAKSNYAGTLARRFETNRAVAGIMGVEGLLHRVETFEQAVERISGVQTEDVVQVARRYLDADRTVTVTVGRAPVA